MNEHDYSVEALLGAEDSGLLEPWSFEQSGYTIVKDGYEPAVIQNVKSVLSSCDARSISTVCALVTALGEGEKSIERLAYELGFGTRLPLLQPYIQMGLVSGLIERAVYADKAHEYWKIAK